MPGSFLRMVLERGWGPGEGAAIEPLPLASAGETQRREPLPVSCGASFQLAEEIAFGLLHGHGGVGVGVRRSLTMQCVRVGLRAQAGLPIR